MPIHGLINDKDSDEIHVVLGHATRELWNNYAAVVTSTGGQDLVEEYQAHHDDYVFRFTPKFPGTVTGHVHEGFAKPTPPGQPKKDGIRVNLVTGQVLVGDDLASPRPNNFILELTATPKPPGGQVLRYLFRIHIHPAYDRIWLTPDKLSIHRKNATGAEATGCRFSVRALFTDAVVGDVTDNPEVQWGPAAVNPKNVDGSGNLRFAASDAAGSEITIRASISFSPSTLFDDAKLRVEAPWSAGPPLVAEIVPGSLRMPAPSLAIELGDDAVVPAEHVPNVLIVGDGFTDAEAPAFRGFVIDIVHHMRQQAISFPWNVLRGSMNFWMLHVPAAQYGVSIGAEVMWGDAGAGPVARVMPLPEPPRVPGPAGNISGLGPLIHELGLPLPGDATRASKDILDELTIVMGHDPRPRLGPDPQNAHDAIDNVWKLMTTRGFVDEVDSPLGCQRGRLRLGDADSMELTVRRGGRARMDSMLRAIVADLPDASGVVARRPIGHLWAARANGTRPPDYDLICIVTPESGREGNHDGYFFVNMFAQRAGERVDVHLPPVGNRYEIEPRPPIDRDRDGSRGLLLAHELSHSFALGDEYAEGRGPPTHPVSAPNLQLETDVQRGAGAARVLHGDEIKWRWHRIEAVGIVSAALTLAGGVLAVKLRDLEAVFFDAGNVVHLRQRKARSALVKLPKLSVQMVVDSVDAAANLVRIRPTGVVIQYPDLVPLASAVATFGVGSILYRPVPAPASVHHPTNYPYAEIVAHNIKSFITRNRVPLVAFPAAANVPIGIIADEQLPVFVPDVDPAGVGLAPGFPAVDHVRIVGLYGGGAQYHLGVFHPAGHCIMRSETPPAREYCVVCRYILVDAIDPSLHDSVDREYAPKYPQA